MAKETGGAAFPKTSSQSSLNQDGMDLRDYFAAKAMPVIAYKKPLTPWATIAQNAYEAADAMIAERAKGE